MSEKSKALLQGVMFKRSSATSKERKVGVVHGEIGVNRSNLSHFHDEYNQQIELSTPTKDRWCSLLQFL